MDLLCQYQNKNAVDKFQTYIHLMNPEMEQDNIIQDLVCWSKLSLIIVSNFAAPHNI